MVLQHLHNNLGGIRKKHDRISGLTFVLAEIIDEIEKYSLLRRSSFIFCDN